MKRVQIITTVAALILGASAERIVLQNSGDSKVCQDTYIEETINTSYADEKYMGLELGSCPSCHEKRILIKYDLSSVPKDKEIKSAKLGLYCNTDNASTGSNAKVYYPKANWIQDEADWFESSTGNKWNNEGGDIGLKPVATFEVQNNAADSWFEFDLTETIKEYVSGEKENRGFIILLDDIDNLYIESSEAENESHRPKLTIETEGTAILNALSGDISALNTVLLENEIRVSGMNGAQVSLSMYTLSGKKVASGSVGTSLAILSTEGLAKGAYLLNISIGTNVTSRLIRLQ